MSSVIRIEDDTVNDLAFSFPPICIYAWTNSMYEHEHVWKEVFTSHQIRNARHSFRWLLFGSNHFCLIRMSERKSLFFSTRRLIFWSCYVAKALFDDFPYLAFFPPMSGHVFEPLSRHFALRTNDSNNNIPVESLSIHLFVVVKLSSNKSQAGHVCLVFWVQRHIQFTSLISFLFHLLVWVCVSHASGAIRNG